MGKVKVQPVLPPEKRHPPKKPGQPLTPRSEDHSVPENLRHKGKWNPQRDRS